jgi:hypothetical protein
VSSVSSKLGPSGLCAWIANISNKGFCFRSFDCASEKVPFAKLYDRKNALVAADVLNDRVLPFFEEQDVSLSRILTAAFRQVLFRQNANANVLRLSPPDERKATRPLFRCNFIGQVFSARWRAAAIVS